jgi:hypothetical protein
MCKTVLETNVRRRREKEEERGRKIEGKRGND